MRNYELLVEAGFATEHAIQIMTFNGAILGLDRRLGSIAPESGPTSSESRPFNRWFADYTGVGSRTQKGSDPQLALL